MLVVVARFSSAGRNDANDKSARKVMRRNLRLRIMLKILLRFDVRAVE